MSESRALSAEEAETIEDIRQWLATVHALDPDDFILSITLNPRSPWLLVFVMAPVPLEYTIWRATGEVHECRDGEVQDPPITAIVKRKKPPEDESPEG